ncbi:hypothetical protein, partial [Psychrobacter celer]|uniref:hypothetical protein n=1 Tax=Psychrobacter celer TaxID=306572 RepID=UPI003FD6B893
SIVIGRLYNSANPPSWGYPQASKPSGIKSKSFKSSFENLNELMFNDMSYLTVPLDVKNRTLVPQKTYVSNEYHFF